MLKQLGDLMAGKAGKSMVDQVQAAKMAAAPKTLHGPLNPLYYRPAQSQNLDVDFVQGAIQSAQGGDMTPLLAIYRDIEVSDGTIQSAISTRKLAVLARGFNVVAAKNSGDAGQKNADAVQAMLERSNSFVDACTWLLHGCIWPVAVVERRWVPGATGFSHAEFRNVPLELLCYRTRSLRIFDVGERGELLATSHYPAENRYITHRGHMLTAPDNWGGPMRALIFWFLFSTQDREWWARFLERFGAPFLVGYYDKNDDESRLVLEQAFQEATRLFGVVATRETQIEIKESGNTGNASQAFQAFHECAKTEKLLLILGQTLSAKTEALGMGGGGAGLQGRVREDVKLWDAFKLANTVKCSVIEPWMRLNGLQGPVPALTFGGFDPEAMAAMSGFLEALPKAGLQLSDDSVDVVSRHAGLTLERTAAKPVPPMMGAADPMLALAAAGLPPSVVANEAVSRGGAADLSRAFSGELAPLNEIVASSRTKTELLSRAAAWLSRFQPRASAEIIAQAMDAHAANALI